MPQTAWSTAYESQVSGCQCPTCVVVTIHRRCASESPRYAALSVSTTSSSQLTKSLETDGAKLTQTISTIPTTSHRLCFRASTASPLPETAARNKTLDEG